MQFYIKKKNCVQEKFFFVKNVPVIIKLLVYIKLLSFTKHANRLVSYL